MFAEPGAEPTPRPTLDAYPDWVAEQWDIDLDEREAHYNYVSRSLLAEIESSVFWARIREGLRNLNADYLLRFECELLSNANVDKLQIHSKPYSSVVEKSYRRNVLGNNQWPDTPEQGWVTPDNWFSEIKDITRTLIVVKYLDCAELVAELIRSVATDADDDIEVDFEARDEGYYAIHNVVRLPLAIPGDKWEVTTISAPFELQVATQLQEVIRTLSHKEYESRRLRAPDPTDRAWQWNWKSEEFVPNYLGHILHYVEGMIMDVREKQSREVS